MKIKLLLLIVLFSLQFSNAQSQSPFGENLPIDYDNVDLKPGFPGGIGEFNKFVGKNFVVPEVEGLSGTIKVDFVIEANGTITDVQIVNDIGEGTAEEAKRVILMSPKWLPGEQSGKRVRVTYRGFPIKIQN